MTGTIRVDGQREEYTFGHLVFFHFQEEACVNKLVSITYLDRSWNESPHTANLSSLPKGDDLRTWIKVTSPSFFLACHVGFFEKKQFVDEIVNVLVIDRGKLDVIRRPATQESSIKIDPRYNMFSLLLL
jgi:hypothetical protein